MGLSEIRQGQVRFLLLRRPVSHRRVALVYVFVKKLDNIDLSEVEFILQVIAGVSQILFDGLAGCTVTAEAFESFLAGLFYTEAWGG